MKITLTLLIISLLTLTGCYDQPECKSIVEKSFTNTTVIAKSVKDSRCCYIVKCQDGSIWECKVNDVTGSLYYKQCLFDSAPIEKE